MTNQQINEAIAEACGIVGKDKFGPLYQTQEGWVVDCPNYCTDLNAMHEAEKTLKGYNQIHTYVWHLNNRKDWETDFKLMEVHISARDRAEAFLLTLGKWSATDKESSAVQDVGWPSPGTRTSRMNADGKWEEIK